MKRLLLAMLLLAAPALAQQPRRRWCRPCWTSFGVRTACRSCRTASCAAGTP